MSASGRVATDCWRRSAICAVAMWWFPLVVMGSGLEGADGVTRAILRRAQEALAVAVEGAAVDQSRGVFEQAGRFLGADQRRASVGDFAGADALCCRCLAGVHTDDLRRR